MAPACMSQVSLIGHSLSAGMNFLRLSRVGMCSLSPCSAQAPRVGGYFPPNQYAGGRQLYGPSMWTPSHRCSPFASLANEETVSTTDRKSIRLNSSHLGI